MSLYLSFLSHFLKCKDKIKFADNQPLLEGLLRRKAKRERKEGRKPVHVCLYSTSNMPPRLGGDIYKVLPGEKGTRSKVAVEFAGLKWRSLFSLQFVSQ